MFAVAREVDLRCTVHRGGGLPPVPIEGRVREPSAGVVLDVLSGDDAERRAAVREWLPPSLASRVAPLPEGALGLLLVHVLAAFSPQASATASASKGAPEADLMGAVFAVGARLGMAPSAVLAMPWGQFIEAGRYTVRARTEDLLGAASAARVAQASPEDWKKFRRALEPPQAKPAEPEITPEEQARIDAQAEHVRRQVEHYKATGSTLYGNVGEA